LWPLLILHYIQTSKGCQVERLAFQEWAMTLERFSPRLLISSIKRALISPQI
jgi:hypothetical protein